MMGAQGDETIVSSRFGWAGSFGRMCPAIGAIQQQKQKQGYCYFAVAPGAGWNGENLYAQESYLAGLKFICAAIRTG